MIRHTISQYKILEKLGEGGLAWPLKIMRHAAYSEVAGITSIAFGIPKSFGDL